MSGKKGPFSYQRRELGIGPNDSALSSLMALLTFGAAGPHHGKAGQGGTYQGEATWGQKKGSTPSPDNSPNPTTTNVVQDPNAIDPNTGLPKALVDMLAPPNPLGLQMFFQNVLAPYLNQLGGQMQNNASQYGATMNQLLGSTPLNPAIKNAMAMAVPGNQAAMNNTASAFMGAGMAAPALDALMQQMTSEQGTQNLLRQEIARQIANQSVMSMLPGLGGSSTTGGSMPNPQQAAAQIMLSGYAPTPQLQSALQTKTQ